MSMFYVAALTGRSGSGKSYAGEYLRKKGVPSVNGDLVAREVVQKGEKCLDELVKEFGSDILNEDGTLNRRMLADMCFANEKLKNKLNRITHPAIIKRMLEHFDELREQGYDFCLVEAAALTESGLYAVCDRIIMIQAGEQLEIERIMSRDGLTLEQAKTRLDAQQSPDELRALCDVVIENNGTLAQFEQKLDELYITMKQWFEE